MPERPLFLIGMMGSGKSTVGRVVARDAGVPFVDLDLRVERIMGQTIAQLFSVSESHFRDVEQRCLEALLREPGFHARGSVVATGGGVVVRPANIDALLRTGTVVYLRCPAAVLLGRLREDATRPLLGDQPAHTLEGLLAQRSAAYERAQATVDAADELERVAARVRQAWEAA